MKAVVLIVPEWLTHSGPPLRSLTPILQKRCETDTVVRVASIGESLPEAAYLGLDIESSLPPGPLFVAAFGAEPPSRSVHFCLTLCGLVGDVVCPVAGLQPQELEAVKAAMPRLNTKKLTAVWGFGTHHGMVWESGSLDVGETSFPDAVGRAIADCLPRGEGETILRRYIDDSVDLLSELTFNARRLDQGLPPANLLWPWGPGFPPSIPNLNLSYGPGFRVESALIPVAGLAKLGRANHGDLHTLGSPSDYAMDHLSNLLNGFGPSVVVIDWFSRLARTEDWERFEVLSREVDELADECHVIAPSAHGAGLALLKSPSPTPAVFDQMALDDHALPGKTLSELVREALRDPQATANSRRS